MKKFRETAGFTLVELIVVIAIMGILAGIGTAGYGGYINYANKGADKQLVGNIVRAIETGTNSTMFVNDESHVLGSVTYPVGVIALTNTQSQVLASTSTHGTTDVDGTCHVVEGTFYKVTQKSGSFTTQKQKYARSGWNYTWQDDGSAGSKTLTYYELVPETHYYCATHTTLPAEETFAIKDDSVVNQIYGDEWTSGIYKYRTLVNGIGSKSVIDIDECVGINALAQNHTDGGTYAQGSLTPDPDDEGNRLQVQTSTSNNALYDSLEAAFGNPADLKLSWDGWGKDESHTYSTLLANSDKIMTKIEDTAKDLMDVVSFAETLGLGSYVSGYLSEDYNNDTAVMMDSFANFTVTKYPTQSAWLAQWKAAETSNRIDYPFGFPDGDGYHNDYIYAATKAYNMGFSSYCESKGISDPYLGVIDDFATPANDGIASNLGNACPRVVNTTAFNMTGSEYSNGQTLKKAFLDVSDTDTEEQADKAFEDCKKLYAEYLKSPVYEENGKSIYDMLTTVAATGSDAYISGEGGSDSYFNYYQNYLQEMTAFYKTIDENADSGIMIIVTVQNGEVVCEVSPAAADPRNDD